MAKFATNLSGAILLPSSIQVTESISGSVVPLAMFCEKVKALSHEHNYHHPEEMALPEGDDLHDPGRFDQKCLV